ncbi:twitching motility protein PilT [Secundilactobacillus oryzae JCM 18671]|uniref:Twitching motility protein PilT n=1 Tax=Secundilactobacillus oryzae JCM 18671 TaxID=1291743 RepID=A0A081BJD1_9LACO|nr:PIN/TRAM domain-containing protein [Secundilactobacillus oryzae]GAK48149.1 twitching motility protein PilT [Secundilactobacillus oryzae JCM 18671]
MQRKTNIIRLIFVVVGIVMGITYTPVFWELWGEGDNQVLNNFFTNAIIGLLIFSLLSFIFSKWFVRLLDQAEQFLSSKSPIYLLFGSLAMIIGLVIAVLISTFFFQSDLFILNTVVPLILMLAFAYLGFRLGTTRLDEWGKLFQFRSKRSRDRDGDEETSIIDRPIDKNYHHYKILDTNILIDGRIYDIAKTGFLEGTLLVPNFVLYELQYIADSSDSIKRVRGRRGLDILNKLQNEDIIPVEMYEGDYEDIPEVDSKLIRLAKEVNGIIVTNDYNLNKVIEFQNVSVLNINALSNALKPRVIPGETLKVMVVKNGSERQQGVAYLDDGTMVVVEEGRFYLNQTIEVTVTSAIQTDAGRMIFAKPEHSSRGISDHERKASNGSTHSNNHKK